MSQELLPCVQNAWEHWKRNKDEIRYFGFKDWLVGEYGLIYSGTINNFTARFLNEHGRVLFMLTWS